MIDFRDININEELSLAESADMLVAGDLIERLERRRNEMSSGINFPWEKLRDRISMKAGELTLLGGYSGHFKSTISSMIGLSAMRQGHKVGIASLELLAEDVVEQYAELAAANFRPPMNYVRAFSDWASDRLSIYDRTDMISPSEAIQMVIAFAKHRGCQLIVLDALMMMGVTNDVTAEGQFAQTLVAVAKKFKVHILLIHHVRKPQSERGEEIVPGKYDFLGSSLIGNVSQNIIIVWHDKVKAAKRAAGAEFDDDRPDLLIKVCKQRNGRYEGTTGYWQSDKCRGFSSGSSRRIPPLELSVERSVAA